MDAMSSHKWSKSNSKRSISKLPDGILQRILSFLPTKDAVKTSLLSRRWEYIWTSIPNLEFREGRPSDNFMPFVDRAISLHISDIKKFTLECYEGGYEPCIKRLIAAVVRRNVEELHVDTDEQTQKSLQLPQCPFVSASLTRLDLSICCTLKFPPSSSLSSLKHLRFEYITFTDDVSTQRFFSGCPALATICFDKCNWTNLCSVGLRAPKLWKLEIMEAINEEGFEASDGCEVMVFAPSLHYFDYNGEFLNDYCIYDSPTLNEANIYLRESVIDDLPSIFFCRLYKLLKGISNVKQLSLSSIEELNFEADLLPYMPCFNNLSTLSFNERIIELNCEALKKMLQCSPHLENLCFKRGVQLSSKCKSHELIFDPVPPCFLSHLKRIEIYQHSATKKLHKEIGEILLSRAVTLDKLMVCYSESVWKTEELEKVHKELLGLPRASKVLEIKFTSGLTWKQSEAFDELVELPRASEVLEMELR